MTRFIALLKDPAPLGGICPSCDGVMDASGCRIGEHLVGTSPSGITQVVEVFCAGVPTLPVVPCPSCEAAE